MTEQPTRSDIDNFIDSIDPATMRDGKHLREIAAARKAVEDSQARLQQAVDQAREAGDSWTAIGMALRTSKQNAYRKFGQKQ
ncbi:hypothetical protein [Nesterenkonia alba]|uniref:hypothetical protein n=1 Tax=Nesterenkonia alba TaxID=515814 RepID=UPI0003B50836|nr:hypothetical protein [Nesterenkonia alba]